MKNYLEDDMINLMFETNSKEIFKKAITLGSTKPDANTSIENNEVITFVKGSDGELVEETRNTLTDDVVIARNPEPVGQKNGKDVFNEWLVPKETWLENYGIEASDKFKEYQKKGTIKALEIDDNVLELLGSEDGLTAKIAVDWSEDGMTVYKGGVLTDKGYGIAPDELKATYDEVKPKDNSVSLKNNNSKLKR